MTESTKNARIALVVFNLGGPDSTKAIRPFLHNLFKDPNIITAPTFVRRPLAWLISTTRYKKVTPLYEEMGGGSPIVPNTEAQMEKLSPLLQEFGEVKPFICMRYWHPMSKEVVKEVKAFNPDKVILLPLYPQFSTTTSGSSFEDWMAEASRQGLDVPTNFICCYPTQHGFTDAVTDLVRPIYKQAKKEHPDKEPRILFSAHGLPKKIVEDKGDPYPIQIQQTADAIAEKLGIEGLDWLVSYQSKVGPLEWIKPYTEEEIHRAGKDNVPLIIAPIAFVSEHLETLVELDVEYSEVAQESGVPGYYRVPAVGTHDFFIQGLLDVFTTALERELGTTCHLEKAVCQNNPSCAACPNQNMALAS